MSAAKWDTSRSMPHPWVSQMMITLNLHIVCVWPDWSRKSVNLSSGALCSPHVLHGLLFAETVETSETTLMPESDNSSRLSCSDFCFGSLHFMFLGGSLKPAMPCWDPRGKQDPRNWAGRQAIRWECPTGAFTHRHSQTHAHTYTPFHSVRAVVLRFEVWVGGVRIANVASSETS